MTSTPRSTHMGGDNVAVDDDAAEIESDSGATRVRAKRAVPRERVGRSRAAQRAIDRSRRRARNQSQTRDTEDRAALRRVSRRWTSPRDALQRMPFAVVVVGLLSVGLGMTLWLSTSAAQQSYKLSAARDANSELEHTRDALQKSYEQNNSAPVLASEAKKLGMVPPQVPPAHLVVGTNNKVHVIGDPAPVNGPPAPDLESSSLPSSTSGQPSNGQQTSTRPTAPSAGSPVGPQANVLPSAGSASAIAPGANTTPPAAGHDSNPHNSANPSPVNSNSVGQSTDSSTPR